MRFMRIVFVLVILAAGGGLAFLYLSSAPDRRDNASLARNGADTGSLSAALGQFTPLDPPRGKPAERGPERTGISRTQTAYPPSPPPATARAGLCRPRRAKQGKPNGRAHGWN